MLRALCLTAVMFLPFAAGCGGGVEGGKPVFKVSGVVTLEGNPLGGATVTFAPQDGQPTAFGRTDEGGNFVLTTYQYGDGAAEGKFKVLVNLNVASSESTSSSGDGSEHEPDNLEHSSTPAASSLSLVPAKYGSSSSTPLDAEVTAGGDNKFEFALTAN